MRRVCKDDLTPLTYSMEASEKLQACGDHCIYLTAISDSLTTLSDAAGEW